ncbi:MAG: potassium/proton antiporter [Longimicrobiales bacterium]
MFAVDWLILIAALLVLFAIASSKFSTRLGLPVLVIFIALGMLAGSEGFGGIEFENYVLAHGIGTAALAVILFDGGLRTSITGLKTVIWPAAALATVGVTITALITGLAAARLLGIPLLEGMLLGSIVGSTDAAAVFAVLRGRGVRLHDRLSRTLEVESGANDPMAIFLTVALLEVLLEGTPVGLPLLGLFLLQMSVGAIVGLAVGRFGVELNNRLSLDAAGLYPVLMAGVGFLAYGAAANLGGSGFLSVYIAGMVLGNSRLVFRRGTFLFIDAVAWLGQIVMFTVLGLLTFPSRLIEVAPQGLLLAATLIFVARPLAVIPLLLPFRFRLREIVLVAWVGLRGAVPIILATYPLLRGLPDANLLFDIVFFVVLVSAITQGWTLPHAAQRLGLQAPPEPEPPVTLEITSLRDVEGDIVEYLVLEHSRAAGKLVRELALPDGAVIAMIARGQELIAPRGSTRILAADHVFLMVRPEIRTLVDRIFAGRRPEDEEPLPIFEFPLSARTRVADLIEFYGIAIDADPNSTLEDLIRERAGPDLRIGTSTRFGSLALRVREMSGSRVEQVGLQLLQPESGEVGPPGLEPGTLGL